MKSASLSAKYSLLSQSGLASGLLRRSVLRQLQQLRHGHLRIYENGELLEFGDSSSALTGEVEVLDAAFWGMVASNGSIGAGEAVSCSRRSSLRAKRCFSTPAVISS